MRLIFSYDGDDVKLLSRRRVEMTLPPGLSADAPDRQGFWAEVRRADGEVLHRTAMHPPIQTDTEVFSEDPERSVRRAPVEHPHGAFTVVVPDLPQADHLALIEAAPEGGDTAQPRIAQRSVARFSLSPTDREP